MCIAKRITVNGVSSNERCYCSLVAFREAFFVNKVHRKPENCGAKRVTVNGVNSNRTVISEKIHANYVWFTYGNYDKIYL